MMNTIKAFFHKEPVLSIAAVAAALSMLLVPPSAAYLGYIDVRVLCLLFCLMAVVLGFQSCGVFAALALFRRDLLKVRAKDLWIFVGGGMASIILFNYCYFQTIQRASLSTAAILLYTSPVFVLLL